MSEVEIISAVRRSDQAWCEQVCQWESLGFGVAYWACDFTSLAEGQQLRDIWLNQVDPRAAYEQTETFFRERGLTCSPPPRPATSSSTPSAKPSAAENPPPTHPAPPPATPAKKHPPRTPPRTPSPPHHSNETGSRVELPLKHGLAVLVAASWAKSGQPALFLRPDGKPSHRADSIPGPVMRTAL